MRKDWVVTSLDYACRITMGQSPPGNTYNETGEGLPFFQGKADFTELHPIPRKWCSEPKKIAHEKDILLSVRAPVGTTNIANTTCCIGRGLAAISYDLHKYLFYYLKGIESLLDQKGTGTTFKAISANVLKEVDFPLAPLPEQRAIVSKIELLFSELDNAVSNLKQAKDKLEIFRQSVLKKAFEGELTKVSKKWEKNKLGDVIKIKSGDGLSKSNRNDTGKYLVYGGNGITGRHSEYMFEEQRLIIGRVGVHCGNAYITKQKSWVTDNAFVVDFDKEKIDIMFLLYLIGDLNLNQYSNSTAQPVISGGTVYPVEFYLPNTIKEQQEIVKEIETRFTVADKLAESIDESLLKAEALRQSILKKAFEGELLSKAELDACRKEADWEPAEKLLERIKREKK